MKSGKKPSIFTNRSGIGSYDELDEYGVWVKSEPEDIQTDTSDDLDIADFFDDDLSQPPPQDDDDFEFSENIQKPKLEEEIEELETLSALDGDASGLKDDPLPDLDIFDIDDILPGEGETACKSATGEKPSGNEGNAVSAELLIKIADELSSIKTELATLKSEVTTIREPPVENTVLEELEYPEQVAALETMETPMQDAARETAEPFEIVQVPQVIAGAAEEGEALASEVDVFEGIASSDLESAPPNIETDSNIETPEADWQLPEVGEAPQADEAALEVIEAPEGVTEPAETSEDSILPDPDLVDTWVEKPPEEEVGAFEPDEKQAESGEETEMDRRLKSEIKTVLAYIDQLLDFLPYEKIIEFAHSDKFLIYKKVFKDLGLAEE
ncbi:MAG: hypothetical protein LBT01_05380 [Spirochaetaceae bacterium]|jgi:hypothetical protein|nr:hypothetical protein [Spirochaetaceae bacterium]